VTGGQKLILERIWVIFHRWPGLNPYPWLRYGQPAGAAAAVVAGIEIYIPLADIIDLGKERTAGKEIAKAAEEVARVNIKTDQ